MLYPSSFVGTLKNEIPGAALELCQLKLKQFPPEILKFSTKHEVILLLSTVLWFVALVCLYLMQACVDWVLIIFGTHVIEKKRPVRPVFPDYLSISYDYGVMECIIESCISRHTALWLVPGPGSQFLYTSPGPQFVFTGSGPRFVFSDPSPKFVFTGRP